jgi:hypothetical protein
MPLLKRAIPAALLLCLPLGQAGTAAADAYSENESHAAAHWADDPRSGCALFDASLHPGDSVSWSGACKEGRADGPGTAMFSNNGAPFESFTGDFADGVAQDGAVTVSWGDGWRYDGEMLHGQFDGEGTLVNNKGDHFEGWWKAGKLNGSGSVTRANGERYDGAWKNDLPNGQGLLVRADGSRLQGEFLDGKLTDATPLAAAPLATQASLETKVPAPAARPPSALAQLSGKKLIAVDGAALNLTAIEGGIERDITNPSGSLQKTTFTFINDRLGTVAADGKDGANNVTGFFRLTDNGVEVRYADGGGEILSANEAGGVTLKMEAPGTLAAVCRSYYPEGHAFSDAEKKAAVAEYANRLGLGAPPPDSACPKAMLSSAPPLTAPLSEAKPAQPQHHAETLLKHPAKFTTAPPAAPKGKVAALENVTVRNSVVHAIDAMPLMAGLAPSVIEAEAPQDSSGGPKGASSCLAVESDGTHWGFRNSCGHDVQFSYCLAAGGNTLTGCDAGGVAGSVAANSFGALLADKSFGGKDADHDFRWLACDGGAGEVVAHLDRSDPPAGRCVRAGDIASNK